MYSNDINTICGRFHRIYYVFSLTFQLSWTLLLSNYTDYRRVLKDVIVLFTNTNVAVLDL